MIVTFFFHVSPHRPPTPPPPLIPTACDGDGDGDVRYAQYAATRHDHDPVRGVSPHGGQGARDVWRPGYRCGAVGYHLREGAGAAREQQSSQGQAEQVNTDCCTTAAVWLPQNTENQQITDEKLPSVVGRP